MKVVYTGDALTDLEEISSWLADHYPMTARLVAERIESVGPHIGRWPSSARRVNERRNVRALPLGRYPYIFYTIADDAVRILRVRHAARKR